MFKFFDLPGKSRPMFDFSNLFPRDRFDAVALSEVGQVQGRSAGRRDGGDHV
jgi:hypothetical protein